ncbi:hypothetical protein [Pedobacter sp. Leaf132]|uniref:hypothetical protein n=1 Tax=Pedobacter sp. Leaf132 TaxID=2876557 RepID=UPI001E2B39CB|nr:hypothetical protein [Pedobacter sp. Leaf132]
MESNTENQHEEEIINPEQFQVGRAPQDEKEDLESDEPLTDDAEYTEEETGYADGKGTLLDNTLGEDQELDNEESSNDTFEDQDFGNDEGKQSE